MDAHGGSEQHGVAGAREPRGVAYHLVHDVSVRARDLDHGDLGRVSRERIRDHRPVLPDQHDAAKPRPDRGHERVEGRALGQPAGDPDHRVVGTQRSERRVRVGRLAVVDVGDAVDVGDLRDPVRVRA